MGTLPPPGAGLQTQADIAAKQLQGAVDSADARRAAKATGATPTRERPDSPINGKSLPWRTFKQRHPEYNALFWEQCRAFYSGGPRLLADQKLMERVFPKHNAEPPIIYNDRVRRAHYFPYAGTIIDHLVSGLAADPVRPVPDSDEEGAKLPEDWAEFFDDVSPPGGKRQSLDQLLIERIREALITRTSWILVDMPAPEAVEDPSAAPTSVLDQERQGLLQPYFVGVDAEYVIDWQDDANGELEWALICDTTVRREGLAIERRAITHTFTYYDREGWERYQITYDPQQPPNDDTPVLFVDAGTHTFGKVPLVRIHLPEGLWAMGKLESLAREHFNKRNAQANAENRSLYAVLYEFQAPEDGTSTNPVSAAQEDPNRGVNQVRGQGYTQVRGHQDDARFIGPDVAPFAEARASCQDIMREMHRVMFSMALSVDMGSEALKRSGESKAQDRAVDRVVLRELGRFIRECVRDLMELAEAAKGELECRITGGDKFDSIDVNTAITEGVELLNGVPMKSVTFKKAYLYRLYKLVMGDELTPEELAQIKQELDEMVTAEDIEMEGQIALGAPGLAPDPNAPDEDDDPNPDEGEEVPPPKAKPKSNGARKTLYSSSGR